MFPNLDTYYNDKSSLQKEKKIANYFIDLIPPCCNCIREIGTITEKYY